MRQLMLFFILLFTGLSAYANPGLERRIYYFSRMTDLFKDVCFDADGTFREHVVIYEQRGSIRESAIDCDAQALALNAERLEIEAAIEAAGADCDIQITDPALAAFASGVSDVAEQVQCPGNGGAAQCIEGIACNLASSMVPRFTRSVVNFLRGRSQNSSCGSDGGSSCLENLLAGAIFNLKDTGCGIASLFGYSCDEEPNQNSEQASSDAAVIASFQTNESVASFTEDPIGWMKQTASALFRQMSESIMERFGCAQWEDPSRPFMSRCLRPQSWSCADCSAKANMVCGVLGYIGGEIAVSFFTGAAVGIVARAASRIAIEAAVHFPRTTATVVRAGGRVVDTAANMAALSARWAGRGGASLRNIWSGISSTRSVQVLSSVAQRVGNATVQAGRGTARFIVSANDFARRRMFGFAATEDFAVASAKEFNRLAQESFMAGYRFAGQARSSTINNMLGLYPRAEDIRSGAYARQGINTPEDYLRFATKDLTAEQRVNLSVGVTRDGADSRVVIIDGTGARAGVGPSYDLTGRTPASSASGVPITAPRRPEVIRTPPPEVTEIESLVVTGTRSEVPRIEYPVLAPSTRSESDLLRAFGGDTPYNRELVTVARNEYSRPPDFEASAFDLHEAWKAANPQLRQTRPQLFVDYDDLPAAEKLRYADEMERAFRVSNPQVLSSRGFQDYRASLSGAATDVRPAAVGLTVGDGAAVARAERVTDVQQPLPAQRPQQAPSPQGRVAAGASSEIPDTESIIQRFAGNRYDLDEREITIDILLGGSKRDEYFEGSNRSQAFRDRYVQMENEFNRLDEASRTRIRDDFRRSADRVVQGGNERAARELEELGQSSRLTSRDIDCNVMNSLYPGSFPTQGGVCKRVRFDEDVVGAYCACGGLSKDQFNFLTRCPRNLSEFQSVFGFADGVALPSTSLPQSCTRVTIPRGKECYFGSTSATYAGVGGVTQFLCLDEASPRLRRSAGSAITDNQIQIGVPRIQPLRWSPFSDFEDLQAIIERASRACVDVCEVNIFRNLNRDYAAALDRIRSRTTDPVRLRRLEAEQESFQLYMSGLRGGRVPTPYLSRAAGYSDAERLSQAGRILRTELTEAQEAAIIRAHGVGQGRGYFTYSQADISEKARILREAGLDRDQVRRLMRNGIVGGRPEVLSPEDAFIAARSDAVRSRELRGNYREGANLDNVTLVTRNAADGYAAEARRTNAADLTAEAWRLYARSGDPQSANAMMRLGVQQGMDPQRVFSGLQQELTAVNEQIARRPQNVDALIVERNALNEMIRDGRRTLGLPAREIPSTMRQGEQVRPPRVEERRVSRAPDPRPPETPRAPSSALVVGEIPPRRAQDMANDYRLGRNGRAQDPLTAAQLYYRAADGAVQREMRTFRRSRETNFMADRNFGAAFEQSLQADGALTIQMLDEIHAAGGTSAVNAFLAENFQRFNSRNPSAQVRGNIRQFMDHVRERYGNDLYDPQRNYLRSWASANADEAISIPATTRAKIQNHVGLTPEQETFIDNLIAERGGRALNDAEIERLMNNSSAFPGQQGATLEARPFRRDNITSVFPAGVSPDDVIREYNRGRFREVPRPSGSSSDLTPYQVEINGDRYNLYVCTASRCEVDGVTLTTNQVRTVFPNCGPNVRALMKLSRAKNVLRGEGPVTRESFYEPLTCRD